MGGGTVQYNAEFGLWLPEPEQARVIWDIDGVLDDTYRRFEQWFVREYPEWAHRVNIVGDGQGLQSVWIDGDRRLRFGNDQAA